MASGVRHVGFVRALFALLAAASVHAIDAGATDASDTIRRVKPSIVAVGTFSGIRSPAFEFRGSGFAVGNGHTIVTNAHVLPADVDAKRRETIAVLVIGQDAGKPEVRAAETLAVDPDSDLALLHMSGDALSPLAVGNSDDVQEGQAILITGYPLGPILGAYPTTHRGMISAIAPIAIPQPRAQQLGAAAAYRLKRGAFPVFQLDAPAYPGNSGSPIYDAANGEVLGVVNMVFVKGTKEAALTKPSGITYAIPARHLVELLAKTKADSKAR
jgi:S1-C subfamily serine protease